MHVCDVLGNKIGTLTRVYRDESSILQLAGGDAAVADRRAERAGIMEVKTGLLGLGPHLYVPVANIREVIDDSVFLEQSKEDAQRDFRTRPDLLDQLQ
jgi:hypothetical protein